MMNVYKRSSAKMTVFIVSFLALGATALAYSILHVDRPVLERTERTQASHDANSHRSIMAEDFYLSKVQPIFNNRCVACHSCYNSPCQLQLVAFEGVDRGANKDDIYDFGLIKDKRPTRLFIDEKTTEDWRRYHDFYPVLHRDGDPRERLDSSILYQMIQLRKDNPGGGPFHAEESRVCPRPTKEAAILDEWKSYKSPNGGRPWAGMPFGFPPLTDGEIDIIKGWIEQGAPGPSPEAQKALQEPSTGEAGRAVLKKYEAFLNRADFKNRLSARYIYEHLFLAHIHFDDIPGDFYRLVRAINEQGEPIEIRSVRPLNGLAAPFYYRFQKITSTIVQKTHITYRLNSSKLARWRELFIDSQWNPGSDEMPSYDSSTAANPFLTFRRIPIRSRFQFLLDDSFYHVNSFILGPVCRGEVAVGVIDDHFWVFFTDPDHDPVVQHPDFLDEAAPFLTRPAADGSQIVVSRDFLEGQMRFRKRKRVLYKEFLPEGPDLNMIWDGDGTNSGASLTIFRHHDSASVHRGAIGGIPKTIWVLDYPTFEDIYYNLVAGYSVFGNTLHQLKTRLHMDTSRINSQDLFLLFLPPRKRLEIRDQWNQDAPGTSFIRDFIADKRFDNTYQWGDTPTRIPYQNDDLKTEFLHKILRERLPAAVRGPEDTINCCENSQWPEKKANMSAAEAFEHGLSEIARKRSPHIRNLPDVAYIRFFESRTSFKVYSMVLNKEHFNVNMLFFEDDRRDFKNDYLNFFPGFVGSYPNLFLDIHADEVPEFIDIMKNILAGNPEGKSLLLASKFAVSRGSRHFWSIYDDFNRYYRESNPLEAGLIDLNRYINH